jgi:acetyl esterase/lipase
MKLEKSMSLPKLNVWEDMPPEWNPENAGPRPEMTLYLLPGDEVRPLVMVFPGGGYNMLADHEGEPYARRANAGGAHAAVVRYRTQYPEASRPLGIGPLRDAERALQIVRSRAAEWHVDPDRIAVAGSSAGGHLAGTVAVHGRQADPAAADPLDRFSARPNAAILCYAVITSRAYRHSGSFVNLCGSDDPHKQMDFFCVEQHVTAETPPMFIWHTADDGAVPVENALLLAMALRDKKVDFALHVFPHGRHGLGMAESLPDVRVWSDLCETWLKGVFGAAD